MQQRPKAVITARPRHSQQTAVRFAADGYDVCLNAHTANSVHEVAASLAAGEPSCVSGLRRYRLWWMASDGTSRTISGKRLGELCRRVCQRRRS